MAGTADSLSLTVSAPLSSLFTSVRSLSVFSSYLYNLQAIILMRQILRQPLKTNETSCFN